MSKKTYKSKKRYDKIKIIDMFYINFNGNIKENGCQEFYKEKGILK